MSDTNGDYLSRLERVELALERMVEVQELQGRNLTSLLEVQQLQARNLTSVIEIQQLQAQGLDNVERLVRDHANTLFDHEQMLRRIEMGLAEATDKINFLIDREMKREGGPETHS